MKPIRVYVFMTEAMVKAMPEAMWSSLRFQIQSGLVHVLNIDQSSVDVTMMNLDERDQPVEFPRILCCLPGKRQVGVAGDIDQIIGETITSLATFVEVFVQFALKFPALEVATIVPTTLWENYLKQFHTNAHVAQAPELLNGWTKFSMVTTTE